MSIYVIGDVQGCYDELRKLVDQIAFDPEADTLWFTGDLVNRGSGSLQTLRFVKSLGTRAITVLGNHDLHLLAIYCGIRPTGKDPTLEPILEAPDVHDLIQWLAGRPILHREGKNVMVHAALHRDWTLDAATALAHEIESSLVSATRQGSSSEDLFEENTTLKKSLRSVLASLYGTTDGTWAQNNHTAHRLRYATNCFTRMRFCNRHGVPDFQHSGPPGSQPDSLVPWFEMQNDSQLQHSIFIGHWAAMGLHTAGNLRALDSGCVWGNSLTAMRLADQRIFSVSCSGYA